MVSLTGMSIEKLQNIHREKRAQMAALRADLDQIEAVLTPELNKQQAINKVVLAGLSDAEIAALRTYAGSL